MKMVCKISFSLKLINLKNTVYIQGKIHEYYDSELDSDPEEDDEESDDSDF